jgi:uncharacterized membrane protein YgdD (TMEM256/DUF423 family)
MTATSRRLAATAALWGAAGLILCAFASHGVDDEQHSLWMRLGGFCMLIHAAAAIPILGLVRTGRACAVAALFFAGSGVFAGTLAGMTFGGPRWLGAVTPMGGLMMIIGWLLLAVTFLQPDPEQSAPPRTLH